MADNLNEFYTTIKVYDSLHNEIYQSPCPRSLLDRFTFNMQSDAAWPRTYYFKVFDHNNKIRFDSRLADRLMS